MKRIDDVLPFLLSKLPFVRDFEISDWHKATIYYPNSKCRLCHQVVPIDAEAWASKGIGIMCNDCFEELTEWAIIRDNTLIAARQSLFNYYRKIGGI